MKYDINHVNNAIIRTLAELMFNGSRMSAKELEESIGTFLRLAADWRDDKLAHEFPEGYCYPWRADVDSLTKMCLAIRECIDMSSSYRYCQILLIEKIIDLSEETMLRFQQEHSVGIYHRNPAYIRELDDESDWGRWMLALKAVFVKYVKKEV